MFNKISTLVIVSVITVVVTGCANSDFSHKYLMRGQVVAASSDNIVICVGLDDGAQVEQELLAYRFFATNNSGEGDDFYEEITEWLKSSNLRSKTKIQLVYGDPEVSEAMRNYLRPKTSYEVDVASYHKILRV